MHKHVYMSCKCNICPWQHGNNIYFASWGHTWGLSKTHNALTSQAKRLRGRLMVRDPTEPYRQFPAPPPSLYPSNILKWYYFLHQVLQSQPVSQNQTIRSPPIDRLVTSKCKAVAGAAARTAANKATPLTFLKRRHRLEIVRSPLFSSTGKQTRNIANHFVPWGNFLKRWKWIPIILALYATPVV